MGYTHFDAISAKTGAIALGAKGSETVAISSAGVHQTAAGTELLGVVPMTVMLYPDAVGDSTAAMVTYCTAPIAGTVSGYVSYTVSAGTARAVTVLVGSAGAVLLETGAVGAQGTQGAVTTMTNSSGTTSVSAGQSLGVNLGACATAQPSVGVTLYFTPTA